MAGVRVEGLVGCQKRTRNGGSLLPPQRVNFCLRRGVGVAMLIVTTTPSIHPFILLKGLVNPPVPEYAASTPTVDEKQAACAALIAAISHVSPVQVATDALVLESTAAAWQAGEYLPSLGKRKLLISTGNYPDLSEVNEPLTANVPLYPGHFGSAVTRLADTMAGGDLAQLAKQLNCPRTRLSNWVERKSLPTLSNLQWLIEQTNETDMYTAYMHDIEAVEPLPPTATQFRRVRIALGVTENKTTTWLRTIFADQPDMPVLRCDMIEYGQSTLDPVLVNQLTQALIATYAPSATVTLPDSSSTPTTATQDSITAEQTSLLDMLTEPRHVAVSGADFSPLATLVAPSTLDALNAIANTPVLQADYLEGAWLFASPVDPALDTTHRQLTAELILVWQQQAGQDNTACMNQFGVSTLAWRNILDGRVLPFPSIVETIEEEPFNTALTLILHEAWANRPAPN